MFNTKELEDNFKEFYEYSKAEIGMIENHVNYDRSELDELESLYLSFWMDIREVICKYDRLLSELD